ncbi:hypothetical protein ILUMI_13633 [Ignelater luminosus]|uniref:Uncharacterized protein n=1 Tax=Ignelater luminosus TaxID=2038154 RepID=A0A8K0D0D5_IGNLU|nr:hypothetical protein ILUMI_13633 [Ignelater luminosus]
MEIEEPTLEEIRQMINRSRNAKSLEDITRKVNKGTLRTEGSQLIAYAEDLVIITERREIMCKMLNEITEEGRKVNKYGGETKKRQTEIKVVEGSQRGFSKGRDRKYRGKSKGQQGMEKDMQKN